MVSCAAPMLGPSGFRGPVCGIDAARATWGAQSSFHGNVAVSVWPRATVQALLPPDLVLATRTAGPRDAHPVLFLFGDQRAGAPIYGGVPLRSAVVYQEFAMVVPFVRHRGGRFLHSWLPRMVCSWPLATWTGNVHYGFAKRMGRMGWQGPIYTVADERGALLFHAHVEIEADTAADPEAVVALRAALALPLAGVRRDGRFVSAYWDLDFAAARVRRARARIAIDAPFADGLEPGEHAARAALGVENAIWRLSWPTRCRF